MMDRSRDENVVAFDQCGRAAGSRPALVRCALATGQSVSFSRGVFISRRRASVRTAGDSLSSEFGYLAAVFVRFLARTQRARITVWHTAFVDYSTVDRITTVVWHFVSFVRRFVRGRRFGCFIRVRGEVYLIGRL